MKRHFYISVVTTTTRNERWEVVCVSDWLIELVGW